MRNAFYEGYPGLYDKESGEAGEWARKQTRGGSEMPLDSGS